MLKVIILPRQARDKHRESSTQNKSDAFSCSLFSTEFVTASSYEFLVFVSDEPGTVVVGGAAVELVGGQGVYKARVGQAGEAGVRISSSVPVWAMLEDAATNEEQLLFGNLGSDPVVDIDRFSYRCDETALIFGGDAPFPFGTMSPSLPSAQTGSGHTEGNTQH
jgi:hypothetical protein